MHPWYSPTETDRAFRPCHGRLAVPRADARTGTHAAVRPTAGVADGGGWSGPNESRETLSAVGRVKESAPAKDLEFGSEFGFASRVPWVWLAISPESLSNWGGILDPFRSLRQVS